MDVNLQSKDFQLPDRLTESAIEKISKATRFFGGVTSADVEVTRAKVNNRTLVHNLLPVLKM